MKDFLDTTYAASAPATVPVSSIYVALDVGSTQTRSCIFQKDAVIGDSVVLDSNYCILNHDIDHIASPGNSIGSQLEMTLVDKSAENKVKPAFTEVHVVKGDLLSAISNNRQITASSMSKIDQEATYINIISNIAIQLLMHYTEHGYCKESVITRLSVALPPEDTAFKQRMTTFRQQLAGNYEVTFSRLGVVVSFTIPQDFNVISEPEAVAIHQSLFGKKKEDADPDDGGSVCFLDIGGRSTGITIINDSGQLMSDACITATIGGNRLLSLFSRDISSSFNVQEVDATRLVKSISSGTLKLGAQKFNVVNQLNDAKEEFASLIYNELIKAFDAHGLKTYMISEIRCSGRTFGEAPGSPSLMTYIQRIFDKASVSPEFIHVEDALTILIGVALHGILHA